MPTSWGIFPNALESGKSKQIHDGNKALIKAWSKPASSDNHMWCISLLTTKSSIADHCVLHHVSPFCGNLLEDAQLTVPLSTNTSGYLLPPNHHTMESSRSFIIIVSWLTFPELNNKPLLKRASGYNTQNK